MIEKFFETFIKPFWFSSSSKGLKPPYFYGFLLMIALFATVVLFLEMAWRKYPGEVLGSVAGVIATLAGLYLGTLRIFDKGKKEKSEREPITYIQEGDK